MRGVDPVVATLVLILVAVIVGISAYSFVNALIAQTTSQSRSPSSIIVIDAASIDHLGNVHAIVRNVGLKSTSIVSVCILNATNQALIGNETNINRKIDPGQCIHLQYATYAHVNSGDWVIVKVVTSDGASATYKVRVQ